MVLLQHRTQIQQENVDVTMATNRFSDKDMEEENYASVPRAFARIWLVG
jgi:hypothetical protein